VSREEERRNKKAAYDKARRSTPEYKAKQAAYRASPKGKAVQAAYWASPKGKGRSRAYESTPKGKAKRAVREASPRTKARKAAYWLRWRYKLTVEQRDAMIAAQDNRCACCRTLFGLLKAHRPFVDHDHATGRVRGILCVECNTVLGKAADSLTLLRSLVHYLERAATQTAEEAQP
jgi:Recombination endonuclease VII